MRNEQSKITWGKKRRGRSLKVLVVVMPDTVVHPRAVVVHLEHALPAHPTQMTIKTTRFKITKKKNRNAVYVDAPWSRGKVSERLRKRERRNI